MDNSNCAFCNPKKKDWEDSGFYGYRCGNCNQATAFILRSDHSGNLSDEEKKLVENLCEKHYPDLKIKWISEKRKNMPHWYDFLVPK